MDQSMLQTLLATVDYIDRAVDYSPRTWRDHLPAVRSIITHLELQDRTPNEDSRRWQLTLIRVMQRMAFAEPDIGPVQDVADWCLRQCLHLLSLYPEDPELMTLVGNNWLMRAQKSLANISRADQASSSSDDGSRRQRQLAENRLSSPDYVEARGLLAPAVEYLQRAANAHVMRGSPSGPTRVKAAEALMSLGNVSSSRHNHSYFQGALNQLRAASQLQDYTLPPHLATYLEEYGPLYPQ